MTQAATDNRAMWRDLGLDLEKHDALLGVLGKTYQDLFLTQKCRPKGMAYFDFVMSEIHGLRIRELVEARKQGRLVVGSFCVFVPEEIILAVDGISVGLCAGAEFGTAEAERLLPRNTCPLIKSFFGFTMERVCPYVAASDLIVGENTCDGKKKAYEIYADLAPRLLVLDLPHVKTDQGRVLLGREYRRFASEVERLSGRKITAESLRRGIETVNRKRAAMHRLARLRGSSPAPISGMDALLANQVYFYDDPVRFTDNVSKICDELEDRISRGEGVAPADAPRFLISGCPMAAPNWKLHSIIEGAGGVVVGEESCVGSRGTQTLTDAAGESVERMLDAIVDRYLTIDCAVFTPNPTRVEHASSLARNARADGVIHYSLDFCTPYQMEAGRVEASLEGAGLPVLRIETGYSGEDVEQLRTRVEAFIERVKGRS